ncbi:hypothetical protein AMECASPLE_013368 [Ameca splendens]|uniref:Uncharacterized protein n=1 Tax=Ameca splendens TaxID=208324 RepID=A0ABV0YD58_9TELE
MPQSKENQEQIRNKLIGINQPEKSYKAISKALDFSEPQLEPLSTENRVKIDQQIIKEHRTSFKALQASLASAKIKVHNSAVKDWAKCRPWESSKVNTTAHQCLCVYVNRICRQH